MQINVRSNFEAIARDLRHESPQRVERAAQASLNRTAATLRTASRNELQQEIKPKKGAVGSISKRIRVVKATRGNLTALIEFSETGLGVEQTARATFRKVRGSNTGRVRVNFQGKTLVKAFRLGDGNKVFIRSNNKIKRVFSFTVLQEAEKLGLPEKNERRAPEMFVTEFVRLVEVFANVRGQGFSGR